MAKQFNKIRDNFNRMLDTLATRHSTKQAFEVIPLSKHFKVSSEKFDQEHDFNKDPVEKLDMNDLIVTQPDVTEAGVALAGQKKSPINVAKRDDKYYVVDGHHRLMYRKLKGKSRIKANVWNESKS